MNESYKTSDIYLAAYLKLAGKQLVNIERSTPKKALFVFIGDCELEADDFYNGDSKKFLDYARALKDIKAMMYTKMEGEPEYGGEPRGIHNPRLK